MQTDVEHSKGKKRNRRSRKDENEIERSDDAKMSDASTEEANVMSQERHELEQACSSETKQMKEKTSRSGSFMSRCGPDGTNATAEGKKGIPAHRQSINVMHAQVHTAATKGNKYSINEIICSDCWLL